MARWPLQREWPFRGMKRRATDFVPKKRHPCALAADVDLSLDRPFIERKEPKSTKRTKNCFDFNNVRNRMGGRGPMESLHHPSHTTCLC